MSSQKIFCNFFFFLTAVSEQISIWSTQLVTDSLLEAGNCRAEITRQTKSKSNPNNAKLLKDGVVCLKLEADFQTEVR